MSLAREIAQCLYHRSGKLSSIPWDSLKVERENQLPKVVLGPPHVYHGIHTHITLPPHS